MKGASIIIILLIVAAAISVVSKPDDQQCINQLRDQVTTEADPVSALLGVNRYTLHIEDHFFYKQIYSTTGSTVGYGAFGCVWQSQ